jgi:transposase
MKRIPRRLFTEEFKREAIKLVTEQQLNIASAGRQLDVDPKSIRAWLAQAERGELKATLGAAKLTADQQRIRELERELAITREERDILKKATAYFAKLTK